MSYFTPSSNTIIHQNQHLLFPGVFAYTKHRGEKFPKEISMGSNFDSAFFLSRSHVLPACLSEIRRDQRLAWRWHVSHAGTECNPILFPSVSTKIAIYPCSGLICVLGTIILPPAGSTRSRISCTSGFPLR